MDEATSRALSDIREALRGHVDGVVAGQMLQADGTWTGEAGGGLIGKLFGGKKDTGPPGPQKFNLVALTADRVHVLGAKPKSGRWKVTEPVGDWALSDVNVRAHSKRETWRTHEHLDGAPDHLLRSADTIKVALEIRPEGRTLKFEGTVWDGDRLTQATVDALLHATGGKPLEQADDELFEQEFGDAGPRLDP